MTALAFDEGRGSTYSDGTNVRDWDTYLRLVKPADDEWGAAMREINAKYDAKIEKLRKRWFRTGKGMAEYDRLSDFVHDLKNPATDKRNLYRHQLRVRMFGYTRPFRPMPYHGEAPR